MSIQSAFPENCPLQSSSTPISLQEERYSYLLRLWRSEADGEWRAAVQSVQTGERHMFADLKSLLAFFVEQVRPPT